jgi:hypothetical protein
VVVVCQLVVVVIVIVVVDLGCSCLICGVIVI